MDEHEYDIHVNGKYIRPHYTLTLSPDAAAAIRNIIGEFREACRKEPGWFGLREDEDEALEQLVLSLKDEDADDEPAFVS